MFWCVFDYFQPAFEGATPKRCFKYTTVGQGRIWFMWVRRWTSGGWGDAFVGSQREEEKRKNVCETFESETCRIYWFERNKTGLQPVSKPVEQVPLIWGLGSNPVWCQGCADREIQINRHVDRQTMVRIELSFPHWGQLMSVMDISYAMELLTSQCKKNFFMRSDWLKKLSKNVVHVCCMQPGNSGHLEIQIKIK